MEFRCRLATPDGTITEEVRVADSETRLRHDLEQRGLCVLAVRPRRAIAGLALALPQRRRIPSREFLVFNQELATLLKAGMPLVQSLEILRQRLTNPVLRSVLDDVYERVRGGASLSDAFVAQGDLFPGVYTASLMAGEKSGSLEIVLRRSVGYMKVLGSVRRRALSALVYPAVLTTLALIVVGIIVLKVIPEFAAFYDVFNAQLPATSRALFAVSIFLKSELVPILAGLAALVVVAWVVIRRPRERTRFDQFILRVPVVGATVRKFATSQLARTLATLLGGGIPLVNAVEIAARSIGNQHMAREMEWVGQRVREGESFASALQSRGVFPSVAVKMAEVGESTGALQEMLNSLADFYDEEIETDLGRFVTLVEPVLLIVMGLVIASLLLSLYMPLIQLSAVVGRG
jgi:type IV pilus assembly protein PilC